MNTYSESAQVLCNFMYMGICKISESMNNWASLEYVLIYNHATVTHNILCTLWARFISKLKNISNKTRRRYRLMRSHDSNKSKSIKFTCVGIFVSRLIYKCANVASPFVYFLSLRHSQILIYNKCLYMFKYLWLHVIRYIYHN